MNADVRASGVKTNTLHLPQSHYYFIIICHHKISRGRKTQTLKYSVCWSWKCFTIFEYSPRALVSVIICKTDYYTSLAISLTL